MPELKPPYFVQIGTRRVRRLCQWEDGMATYKLAKNATLVRGIDGLWYVQPSMQVISRRRALTRAFKKPETAARAFLRDRLRMFERMQQSAIKSHAKRERDLRKAIPLE
jgi:hypothetical protein